jgi:tripartite-type tricarboxylate transporter receptor subunit TctC
MRALFLVFLFALSAGPTAAEPSLPAKQITIVVPFAAGGPTDTIARLVALGMSEKLSSRVVVENIGGAGGTIGSARVAKADPDGTTLVLGNIGTHAANAGLFRHLPSDPQHDFEPVALLASVPFVVVAKKSLPVADFPAFKAMAADAPRGALTYGSAGIGSASHLACLLLDGAMGGKASHVPYRSTAIALNDLISGQIDFICDQTIIMIPQIQSGTIRPLAVLSRAPIPQLPNVPTAAASGLPDVEVEAWNALFAPKGTPRAVVDQLSTLAADAMALPDIHARFEQLGAVIPSREAARPDALRAHVAAEIRKWVPIIHNSGVTAEQ